MTRSVLYTTSPLLASKTPLWRSKFIVAMLALAFIGLTARAAYRQVSDEAHSIVEEQYALLNQDILPGLAAEGISFIRRGEWTEAQLAWIRDYFFREVMPVLTPIGLDPSHPFPRVLNKSLNFAIELEGKDAFGRSSNAAIVQAPRVLPRVIRLPEELAGCEYGFVFLSSILHEFVGELFTGMTVLGCYQFRATRNSDLFVDEEEVTNLRTKLQGELPQRHFGNAVRLEVADTCPKHLSDYLLKQFNLSETELYQVNGPVNLTRLFSITGLDSHPELQYTPFTPAIPKLLQNSENIFSVVSKQDILLLHPFESFTPVVDLLRQAAKDPHVLAVRQTLYRSGANSEIVDALVDAARNGKEVTAVIELRARFDEESNLQLASRLQAAGAVVIYGVVGFKTHAKMMLILRREAGEIVRYAHLGKIGRASCRERVSSPV